MVIKWVLGVLAFTVGLQHGVESAGICGTAAIRPHWSDCRKFIECGEETTVVFQCPERSFFNPVTLVCDYAMYHECHEEDSADIGFYATRNFMEAMPGLLISDDTCNQLPLGAKFVNPEDCSQFYHCSPSGPVLFQCPGNLLFDSRTNVCNWPQKVEDCSGITPGPTPNPTPGEGIGECAPNCIPDGRCPNGCLLDFIFLPYPGSCSLYLACEDGCACIRQCEKGLYWSDRLQRCVPRYESECEDPIPLPCPECEENPACPDIDDPDLPTILPLPDRCDGYLKCREGYACLVECPYGLNFNQETGQCEDGPCVTTPPIITTPSEPTPDPTTTTPELTTTTPYPTTTTPDPTTTTQELTTTTPDPTTTPELITTTTELITTTPELITTTPDPTTTTQELTTTTPDPTTTTPDPTTTTPYPTTTTPDPTTTTITPPTPTTITTPPPPTDCPVCPPGVCKPDDRCPMDPCLQCDPVLLPHPDYCEMFLKCTHGFACEMKCPAGLHWSTAANRCDWPFLGDCATGDVPTIPPPADCPLDYRCPAFDNPWDPTMLPHPDDCTKFIKCDNKRGCVRSCPDGLHWSVAHNRCEWPNVAGCDPNIPIPDPECPICPCTPCRMRGDRHPCVDNSVCKRNTLSSLSLPYVQDYTRFYECLGGKACLLDCPRGTRFNQMRQRCEDF